MNKGKIVQVIGPVVDVEFPGALPAIYNAVRIQDPGTATGIPLDYRLPVASYSWEDPLGRTLLAYNRLRGDLIVPAFDDTLTLSHEERVKVYGEGMERVRELLPDPGAGRSIWVVGRGDADPGYTRAFAEIGIADHCGLQDANCKPWLGMPEFGYFSAPEDARSKNDWMPSGCFCRTSSTR